MSERHLDTSRTAYREVIPTLNERQAVVLSLLEGSRPLTNTEIADQLGWEINRVTPRIHELRALGQVKDFGKRRCSKTGRKAYQWGIGNEREIPKRYEMRIVEKDGQRVAVRVEV